MVVEKGKNAAQQGARAADRGRGSLALVRASESGQSLLEFVLLLPILLGFSVIMIRTNTAIQRGIVDQQYARQQALYLTVHSPIYPNRRLIRGSFTQRGRESNQMVIGLSENPAVTTSTYTARASTTYIARKRGLGSEEPKSEPEERANVRIRSTVTLCTQPNVLKNGDVIKPDNQPYTLKESSEFVFCKGLVNR